jgi:predicted ATPase/DNA-binding CsgD family transcriptional regulator
MVDAGRSCACCGAELKDVGTPVPGKGAVFCSNACRQRAYRRRQRAVKDASTGVRPRRPAVGPPLSVDRFVGRQPELAAIARLLRTSRLITVFGPAGVGKTRLAVELANRIQRNFPGGVYVVELGSLTRPEFVSRAVAAAVGVSEQPATPLIDTLTASLRGEHLLLILDNCEHLVEACSQFVAALLRHCPGPQVLVTSREVLRLPGEMIFPSSELTLADAVDLFADRAGAVAPDFTMDDDNRALTELICQRLDRLPLAIELAARMVRLFPLPDIANRLEDRFALLTSRIRETDARHRDLLSAIDWSYDLLGPVEQAVFRRLSMLPGGFDLELVQAVCADLALSPAAVIDLVDGLESKSLIARAAGSSAQARFRQLESIRAYAGRRLADAGEHDVTADHLVGWLTGRATPLLHRFLTNGESAARLRVEYENLLHAVEYLASHADDRLVLLTAALMCCGNGRAEGAYGRDRLAAALSVARNPEYRAFAEEQAAWLAARSGATEEALALARQAVERAGEHGNIALRCRTLATLAYAQQLRGDLADAVDSFAACLELVRQLPGSDGVALALNNLAWATLMHGDLDRAAELVAEALAISGQGTAGLLHTAGVLALEQGDTATAQSMFAESLRSLDPDDTAIVPYVLEGFAIAALRERRVERGLRLVGAAETVRRKTGDVPDLWWRELLGAAVAGARARLPDWRGQALLVEGRQVPLQRALDYALDDAWDTAPGADTASLPLTRREYEVAVLVAEGLTNRTIARQVGVSERTVEAHLEHIRAKLDLRSRTQIAAWVTASSGATPTASV